jgi:hypothetical protein
MNGKHTDPRELEPPLLALEREESFEILRLWGASNQPQDFTLRTIWADPGAWGLALVDIARHAARAYAKSGQFEEREALDRIRQLFDAEWENPTDEVGLAEL